MSTHEHVLAVAYACDPRQGSEAGIGWHLARQLARHAEVTLVTRLNAVAAVEAAARDEGLDLTVVGYDLSPRLLRWKRGARFALPYSYLWQRDLARLVRTLRPKRPFTVAQHLTFASPWIPSGLADIPLPFVFGPVGQHARVPGRFLRGTPWHGHLAETARAAGRQLPTRLDPAVRRTWARADVILSLGSEFTRRVPTCHAHKVRPFLAAGCSPGPLRGDWPARQARVGALRVLFVGRLVALKGPVLALEAFARLAAAAPASTLTFLGRGPLEAVLHARVRALGLGHAVRFLAPVAHGEVDAHMQAADVFLFPSFEGGGMVVPEACGAGLPVVTLAFGGPGEMVAAAQGPDTTDEPRGIVVPAAGSFDEVSRSLGAALVELALDETRRARLARGARVWAESSAAWDHKGDTLPEVHALAREHHRARAIGAHRPKLFALDSADVPRRVA